MSLKKLVRKGKPPHRKISGEPQQIDGHTWFYDGKKGPLVVREFYDKDRYVATVQFVMPWAKVIASARRCGKID